MRYENVVFGYAPDRGALNGVSFDVAPGDTVAIVGETAPARAQSFRCCSAFLIRGRARFSSMARTFAR